VGLQKVERDFRTLKTGLLEVRPVFLRNKGRTRGHVMACLLALKLSREMERRLRAVFGTTETNPHAVTLPDALTALSRLCLLHFRVDEKTVLTRLPKPDARQEEILKALQVPLPGQSLYPDACDPLSLGKFFKRKQLARISHQLFGTAFEGAESGDCGLTLSR